MRPPHDTPDTPSTDPSRGEVTGGAPAAGPVSPPLEPEAFLREAGRLFIDARALGHASALLLFERRWGEEELRRFGEPICDGLIRRARETLSLGSRSTDLLGLHPNADFALLLPGATEEAANRCARRLFDALAREGISINGATLPLEVTIGGAVARPGEELDQLTRRARDAIRKARQHREPVILR